MFINTTTHIAMAVTMTSPSSASLSTQHAYTMCGGNDDDNRGSSSSDHRHHHLLFIIVITMSQLSVNHAVSMWGDYHVTRALLCITTPTVYAGSRRATVPQWAVVLHSSAGIQTTLDCAVGGLSELFKTPIYTSTQNWAETLNLQQPKPKPGSRDA